MQLPTGAEVAVADVVVAADTFAATAAVITLVVAAVVVAAVFVVCHWSGVVQLFSFGGSGTRIVFKYFPIACCPHRGWLFISHFAGLLHL